MNFLSNALLINFAGFFLAIFFATFLFWRACRHELFDNEQVFDIILIGCFYGLFAGRILAVILNYEYFGFSVYKLIFFNIYPAFNFYGFVFGALLGVAIFLRHKKVRLWEFLDLLAAPLVFGLFVYSSFWLLEIFLNQKIFDYLLLGKVFAYFSFYFVLKRLGSKKRYVGYFSGLLMIFLPLIDIVYYISTKGVDLIFGLDLPLLTLWSGTLLAGVFVWYKLSKRKFVNDIKLLFAFLFLNFLGFLRMLKSTDEAGKVSKVLLMIPFTIAKAFLVLLRGLLREIKLGFGEFFYILGIRR